MPKVELISGLPAYHGDLVMQLASLNPIPTLRRVRKRPKHSDTS